MDSLDYRAFDELVRQAHFGKAARRLGQSPSALSRRVQALEEELGVELVERSYKSLTLTEAGATFLRFAREELLRLEGLRQVLAEQATVPEGELRLACTVTACYSILPRLISACRSRYPRISLQVRTQDAAQSFAELESGEVDLAVIPVDEGLPSEYATKPLSRAELVFIGPPGSEELERLAVGASCLAEPRAKRRESARLLRGAPFVVQLAGLERRRLLAWFEDHSIEPVIAAEVRGNEGIIAMTGLGTGFALVPDLVLDRSPALVTRLAGLPAPPGYEVALCARKRALQRRAIAAFWELSDEP